MFYVAAIFGIPIAVATVMLSPVGMGDVGHGIMMMSLVGLVVVPIVAWGSFVVAAVSEGSSALAPLWLGGSVLGATVISFFATAMSYSQNAIINPSGHAFIPYNPYTGWWIGVFSICMLLSCGVWGAFARLLDPGRIIVGVIKTGTLLFIFIFSAATIIFGTPWTG